MRRLLRTAGKVVLAALVLAGAYFAYESLLAGGGAADEESGPPVEPVVQVKTARAKRGTLEATATVYGTVVPRAGSARLLSVSFEAVVAKVFAAPGERVAAGTALLEIVPSPSAALEIAQAKNDLDAAERMLRVAKRKFDEGLATNNDLLQAQQARAAASAHLKNLQSVGATKGARTLRAPEAALVSRVEASPGAVVPAGSPLCELAPEGALEVDLGVQPEVVGYLSPGLKIPLTRVLEESAPPIPGTLRLVSRRRNPGTGLFDAFVSLPHPDGLYLNEYVSGAVPLRSKPALLVPRGAVLPREGGVFSIFTVEKGRAKEHSVRVELQNDALAEIGGGGLKEGDVVVVSGNYELADGMAVKVSK